MQRTSSFKTLLLQQFPNTFKTLVVNSTLFRLVACLFHFYLSQQTSLPRNHETSLLQSKWLLDKWISFFHNSLSISKYAQANQSFSILFCYMFITPPPDSWSQHRHGHHSNLWHVLYCWGGHVVSSSSYMSPNN